MGYTLADAARMLECDRSKVSRIETGQRGIRGKELRELLAESGVAGNERAILERRHDKHPRHVPDPEIARAHQQARAIVAQWLDADWHPALTGRWPERNQQLAATAGGTPD